jgi:hypothetical protein
MLADTLRDSRKTLAREDGAVLISPLRRLASIHRRLLLDIRHRSLSGAAAAA